MRRLGALAALLLATACGSAEDEVQPAPSQSAEGPRTLVAETLALADLGPRIVGPQGDQVESTIEGLGRMVSYVACPASVEAETCDPASLPADTVYTYVHAVTIDPGEAEQADDQFAGATLFRTTQAVPGFSYSIGYDRDQAMEALGDGYDIVTQIEDGALQWRIAASDGWMPGETLTFYWRSTLPPAGPADAYEVQAEGIEGTATGPFPAVPEDEAPS